MNVKYLRYVTLAVLAILVGVTVSGCDGESPTAPSAVSSWVRLERNVVIIGDDSPMTLEQIEDSTYVFSIVEYPLDIEVGDILIGSEGEGYVRLVTGVETAAGRMILHTTRSQLTDAVISGGTEFVSSVGFGSLQITKAKGSIDLAPGAVLTSGGIDLSGLTLFEREIEGLPASIMIDEGYVEFNPAITLGLGLMDNAVTVFRSVTEGLLSYSCAITAVIPSEVSTGGEMRIATVRNRLVGRMGIVPITMIIELELRIAYEFSGSYVGDCANSFSGEYDLKLGADYSRGTWTDIGEIKPSLDAGPLSCIDYAETSGLLLHIIPRLNVELYGECAAAVDNRAYTGFSAHTATPPVWDWTITGGYSGTCQLRPDCFGSGPGPYTPADVLYDTTIRTGPYATDSYIFETLWGTEGSGPGQFSYPRGAATDTDGNLYVADSRNSRIQKFAPDSTFIVKWGREGLGDGQFVLPTGVTVDGAGYIYVTDSGNHRIQKFAPDTAFVTSWGNRGNGPGEFESPTGIVAGPGGSIYVVDTGNHRVQKFSSEGVYITGWGEQGSGPGQFDTPRGVAADNYGNIYVAGCRNNRVQRFSSEGAYLDSWGAYGTAEGLFNCPIAIAADEAGDVYVIDYGNDRLQKFTSTGTFVTLLGSGGIGEGEFDRPEGVAIGRTGAIFMIDSRNSRIQKFAPIQ